MLTPPPTAPVSAPQASSNAKTSDDKKEERVMEEAVNMVELVEDADESAQASAKTPADLKALAESLTLEVLEGMTVKELRTVARDLNVTNMTRKEIRFGKKEDLIASICKYLEQEC